MISTLGQRLRLPIVVVLVLAGLAYFFMNANPKQLRWKENVLLSNGQSIEIERFVKFQWSLPLAGPRSEDITLDASVRSTSEPAIFSEWRAPMVPVMLDRDPATGAWWLVAVASDCRFWHYNQEPRPPYWAFVFSGNRWYREPMPEFAWDRRANLFTRYKYDDTDTKLRSSLPVLKAAQRPMHDADAYAEIRRTMINRCGRSEIPSQSVLERDLQSFRR